MPTDVADHVKADIKIKLDNNFAFSRGTDIFFTCNVRYET